MLKSHQFQRLTFLLGIAGLFAVTADFACLEDVCADLRTGEFRTMDEVLKSRIETLDEALLRSGLDVPADGRVALRRDSRLVATTIKLDRPVKHPDGTVVMPPGWLPRIPEGHPWRLKLTPSDDAYYSFVEERILKAKLYDPENPEHRKAVEAYLAKVHSDSPHFVAWTYAGSRTECAKKVRDGSPVAPGTDAN